MITQLLRTIDGLSLHALRAALARGPGAARKVIGSTLAALEPKRNPWMVSPWDMVRAFASPRDLAIPAGDWTDGCTAPLERFMLALLLRYFAPKLVIEVGTYRGVTTRLLLENLAEDARIFTLDLPPATDAKTLTAASDERLIVHRKLGIEYRDHPRAAQVTQVLGDSFSDATWAQVPGGAQFAFIDASHSYEAVKNDTEKLRPKLAPDAVVVWHDYSETVSAERGVGKYLRELMPGDAGIFLVEGTDMAFRLPPAELRAATARMAAWYPDGDYAQKNPRGVPAWGR